MAMRHTSLIRLPNRIWNSLKKLESNFLQAKDRSYDSAGKIDLILLSDVTGDSHTYGLISSGSQTTGSRESLATSNYTVAVTNGDGKSQTLISGQKFTEGSFAGIAATGDGKLAGTAELTRVCGVSREDFVGTETLWIGDYAVPIDDDVQVYNESTGAWTTLELAKAYTDTFTVYYDGTLSAGAKIRIIVFS